MGFQHFLFFEKTKGNQKGNQKAKRKEREEYGVSEKDNLRDLFSTEELEKVQSVEMIVSGLVNCGWGYSEIKDFILNGTRKLLAT